MDAVTIMNLNKNFGGVEVLKNISLNVQQGERRAIIGPNGAGKTTLFNAIGGEIKVDSGQIHFFGQNVTHMPAFMKTRLGLARTFQINSLFFNLPLWDNLQIALLKGISPFKAFLRQDGKVQKTAADMLKEWDLWSKKDVLVKNLSYGEQRQIEVLLAMASNPKLLLLDEPAAGMSSAETGVIVSMVKALPKTVTVVIIEHDMDFIFELAERITVLHFGKVLLEGSPAEIKTNDTLKEVYFGREVSMKNVAVG